MIARAGMDQSTLSNTYRYQFVSDKKNLRQFSIKARVWVYSGMAAWHFVTFPAETSRRIKKQFGLSARGWGSLRVAVELGQSQWNTSIFPDKKAGAYLLPLKAQIRKKEAVGEGDRVTLRLTLIL